MSNFERSWKPSRRGREAGIFMSASSLDGISLDIWQYHALSSTPCGCYFDPLPSPVSRAIMTKNRGTNSTPMIVADNVPPSTAAPIA